MNDYSGMPLYRVIILSDNLLPLPASSFIILM